MLVWFQLLKKMQDNAIVHSPAISKASVLIDIERLHISMVHILSFFFFQKTHMRGAGLQNNGLVYYILHQVRHLYHK